MELIVTTTAQMREPDILLARTLARELKVPAVVRGNRSLARLREEYCIENIIVCGIEGPVLHGSAGTFFFHPGMAKLRLQQLQAGKQDNLVAAMALKPGMHVLDCTLGLGADAIVCSYVVGDRGGVTALEVNPVIAAITGYGLKHYRSDVQGLQDAMGRIRVVCTDYMTYLPRLPANSFDIVYFDPMFRKPVTFSAGIAPLRLLADHRPVSRQAVTAACRVARQRVVIKERRGSGEMERLGCLVVQGGGSSRVAFGIIKTGED